MNRKIAIDRLRAKLAAGGCSIGSWMQIPSGSVAEILGQAGYDWVAIDMEHGSISTHQLPELFRALELGGTLPLVRLAHGHAKDCKRALDAGAGGVIVPMVESATQLSQIYEACCWPPKGTRGVGFSRANVFGKNFEAYALEAQSPLVIAQIEHIRAVEGINPILETAGLDAILIGPYDLSASLGITGQFEHPLFLSALKQIVHCCKEKAIPCGIHVVEPSISALCDAMDNGYRFIAYSIDSVFLSKSSMLPVTLNSQAQSKPEADYK